ncbi:putative transcription modulator/accessory protein [Trypanosoma cruzi]|uniref:Transcription modulator/accessory protein, putative n=2 Tax=Trypanosoma cruzi TaxID=5693 RepID=Q4DZK1_TRYCC|nr:transcription modulator/accessory protein, putative [Trypanosoma cruzi]EAN97952.1 transcription modulator/accessory protein, putative [Trypanosoma cruzi]PWV13463.1 putative transcription modulator/accessory protein [Trypanosoma cruzi]RNC47949.1 putative mitochondrial transcription modulator/accessory protein [Trypanosoma cruzi]|eukprot:XP_819803.1 transcription modulator/accessory protein [Trypanosoma cruzi strain CL Brener]
MRRLIKCIAAARLKNLPHFRMAMRASSSVAVGEGGDVGKIAQERLYRIIGARMSISPAIARFVVEQTKKGSTVPFLARYRRDETGHLDEKALRQLIDMAEELQEVQRRRAFMLKSLKSRGLLTDELREAFDKLLHLNQLEDAWEPFKEKKTSLSYRGREAGLEPLAKKLLYTSEPLTDVSEKLRSVKDGAKLFQAIIVEEVQRCDEVRQLMLAECRQSGVISSSLAAAPRKKNAKEIGTDAFETLKKKFAAYENRRWSVQRISAHNVLALQRGESKGVLLVKMIPHSRSKYTFFSWARRKFVGFQRREDPKATRLLNQCLEAAYENIMKATHNIIRRDLKKSAEKEAITVFAHSLRHILMQCPMRNARILAMDPGVTKGVKCVALDENGGVLTRFKCIIMDKANMRDYISGCVDKLKLNKIVIGNGTASREVADIVADTIEERGLSVEYAIVSEAGASVYSVSDVAREEFPTLDPMYRGAVSIGRRVIDPLSELVKIPVRSMGIGMYQHDISEMELLRALNRVVESCVTCVGVNALISNRYVMEKIPGVTKSIVDQIVLARYAKKLKSREDLRRVPGMTEVTYQQVAGFFRFPNSTNPLDNTNIHPESYSTVQKLLELYEGKERREVGNILLNLRDAELRDVASRIGCGEATLELVARELASPALDPRSELPHAGIFRRFPPKLADLKPGDMLRGIVQSVTTFGAFVDVGLHDNVLVRGVNIDTVHTGDLLDDLRFEGVDQLGRVRLRYDGVLHARGDAAAQSHRRGLTLESEEFLSLGRLITPEAQPTLSDSLAVVREERQQIFASSLSLQGPHESARVAATVTNGSGNVVKPLKRPRTEGGVHTAAAGQTTMTAATAVAAATKTTKTKTTPSSSLTDKAEVAAKSPRSKKRRAGGKRRATPSLLSEEHENDETKQIVGDTLRWWRPEEETEKSGLTTGGVGAVKERTPGVKRPRTETLGPQKVLQPPTSTSTKESEESEPLFFF